MSEGSAYAKREVLAYHEAGHAVAKYLLHRPFSYVTIESNERFEGHLGGVAFPPGPPARSVANTAALAEDTVLGLFAGPMAAAYLEEGEEYCWWTLPDDLPGEADYDDIEALIPRILKPHYFDSEGRFNYQDAHADLFTLALHMVIDFWPYIQAVAAALLEKTTLTADEVWRLADEVTTRQQDTHQPDLTVRE